MTEVLSTPVSEMESKTLPQGAVCAVVVTFNRKALLRDCLESLYKQSRVPDHIVLVDNHSSDGTLDMVREAFVNRPSGPQLSIVALAENRGGAGGFATGV